MSLEAPAKPWEARDPRAPLHLAMTFEGDALVLGAGTKLGFARRSSLLRKQDSEAFDGARVAAMLAATYGRAITSRELAYIRNALERQSEGQTPLALVSLALAGLPKLHPPAEAAWRLSTADELMKRGMAPRALLEALGIGTAPGDQLDRAYNPDQPRVPAGSGRPSGQWTSEDWSEQSAQGGGEAQSPSPKHPAGAGAGVQIADASSNFAQYLSPIGEAQAANWDDALGKPPNTRHDVGVALTVQKYRDNGFIILSEGPVAVTVPGFATPRIYDCLALDPRTGLVVADEEKTTIYDVIFLKEEQVAKDVAVDQFGGFAPSLGLSGVRVDRVAYSAHCFGCDLIDLRPLRLWDELQRAGINIWFEYLPDRSDYH